MEVADRGGDCGEILEPSPRQLGASGRKSRQHRINAEEICKRGSAPQDELILGNLNPSETPEVAHT